MFRDCDVLALCCCQPFFLIFCLVFCQCLTIVLRHPQCSFILWPLFWLLFWLSFCVLTIIFDNCFTSSAVHIYLWPQFWLLFWLLFCVLTIIFDNCFTYHILRIGLSACISSFLFDFGVLFWYFLTIVWRHPQCSFLFGFCLGCYFVCWQLFVENCWRLFDFAYICCFFSIIPLYFLSFTPI